MSCKGIKRKVVYISLYEGIAIVAASVGLALMSGAGPGPFGRAGGRSPRSIAVLWNLVFNTLFERWESRQAVRGPQRARAASRTPSASRAAWSPSWCRCSPGGSTSALWQALVMDLGLVVFFLVYTFVFNWGFDRVFGLPASAARAPQQPER